MIKGFIISSIYELDRKHNVELLKQSLPELIEIEAVYPQYHKIPFLNKILNTSKIRTGHELRLGELGCLLSHRKIWRKIVSTEKDETFLIIESDSKLLNITMLQSHFKTITNQYDLFFWGAYEGRVKLFNSTKTQLESTFFIGTPLLKTIFCTYGYSINRKTANYLLDKTSRVAYPVDYFKKHVKMNDLKIGAILPELITTHLFSTRIQKLKGDSIIWRIFLLLIDFRNNFICYFK